MFVWLAPLVAMGVTAAVLATLLRVKLGVPMDEPNHRSLHAAPVPRVGGIGVLVGVLAGWLLAGGVPVILFAVLLALGAFSFLDDRWGLSAAVRLPVHLAAAAVWLISNDGLTPLAMTVISILLLGWMINLYNFMDGSNGLAGGMAVFGFGTYGLAAWLGGQPEFAATAWVVMAAALGFLLFNFDPARVFLGDAGSIPLGFLAGALGIAGWRVALWPAWFPLLIFSPFIVDASVTLLRRLLRGERFWQAHREHAYQRLIRSGWTHRRLALAAYLLMGGCALTALLLRASAVPVVVTGLAAWALIYALLLIAAERRWKRFAAGSA